MQAVQNLGLAVIALLAGLIVDHFGYLWLEIFFLSWLSLALATTIMLWVLDKNHSGILNMSVSQRAIFKEEELAAKRESLTSPE